MIDKLLIKKTKLGTGATSTVYKVRNIFTQKGFLCLKILNNAVVSQGNENETKKAKKKTFWEDVDDDDFGKDEEEEEIEINVDLIRQLYLEYEILNNLQHPNIIKVYGFYYGDRKHNPAILLEYCKTNLENVINLLDDADLIGIIYEICSAMKYVHSKKIIHRDLKMKNILINSKKHVNICDFGISKVMDVTTLTSMTHGVGTFAFMAPEIFKKNVKYTEKVDVYAFGVILYFILTKGDYPEYNGSGNYELLTLPRSINELSSKIIKRCWSSFPENRPSFADILKKIVDKNFALINGIEKEVPKIRKFLGLK